MSERPTSHVALDQGHSGYQAAAHASCAEVVHVRRWCIKKAEQVFILEHHFASKSFAAVREASGNAYPNTGVNE
jgi:hypothetical protein